MHCQKPKRQTEREAPLSDGAEEGAVTERPAALAAHAETAGNIGQRSQRHGGCQQCWPGMKGAGRGGLTAPDLRQHRADRFGLEQFRPVTQRTSAAFRCLLHKQPHGL